MTEDEEWNPAAFAFGRMEAHKAGRRVGDSDLDATKQFILDALDDEKWTPRMKITDNMSLTDPAVRSHLQKLEEDGYIESREMGRQKQYRKV